VDLVTALGALAAGFVIAVVTSPVGVSGAVFLLPVNLSGFGVANPAVTPTNLLYNVVATPGPLARYARAGGLGGPLTRILVVGTLPGVIVGALLRVFVVPGPHAFRLIVAVVLAPLGGWLVASALAGRVHRRRDLSDRSTAGLAAAVGVIGGIYGIGGGSILAPILVGRGRPVSEVAPAALASTFATSVVGALTYALLSVVESGDIAPDWPVGLLAGVGGLCGGYVGARLQPVVPERALRMLLGALAVGVAALYVVQAVGGLSRG
jgi:uncharacterized membrane protein YfcA